jgi:hypothetical protein
MSLAASLGASNIRAFEQRFLCPWPTDDINRQEGFSFLAGGGVGNLSKGIYALSRFLRGGNLIRGCFSRTPKVA